jgi:hypothetical protein
MIRYRLERIMDYRDEQARVGSTLTDAHAANSNGEVWCTCPPSAWLHSAVVAHLWTEPPPDADVWEEFCPECDRVTIHFMGLSIEQMTLGRNAPVESAWVTCTGRSPKEFRTGL